MSTGQNKYVLPSLSHSICHDAFRSVSSEFSFLYFLYFIKISHVVYVVERNACLSESQIRVVRVTVWSKVDETNVSIFFSWVCRKVLLAVKLNQYPRMEDGFSISPYRP